jgi:hypothetical protein
MLYIKDIKSEVNADIKGNKILLDFMIETNKLLKPYIDKKVVLKSGLLLNKLDDKFKDIEKIISTKYNCYDSSIKDTFKISRCYVKATAYRFEIKLTLCFSDGNNTSCYYKEFYYIVGKLEDDKLISLNNDYSLINGKLLLSEDVIIENVRNVYNLLKEAEAIQKNNPYYAKFNIGYLGNLNN